MSRKEKPLSSWEAFFSFPQKFSYEIDAPIQEVITHLSDLEQEPQFFRSSQEISILPVQDHYVFRVRRRRHGTLTVSAEGQISQDETGCVIVEGESRVNGWAWIAPLILMSLFGIILSIVSTPPNARLILLIPFFISMLIGFSMSFAIYRRDRSQLIHQMQEIVTSIKQPHGKQKRASRLALENPNDEAEWHLHEDDLEVRKKQR